MIPTVLHSVEKKGTVLANLALVCLNVCVPNQPASKWKTSSGFWNDNISHNRPMCNKAAVEPVTSLSVPPSAPSSCVIKKKLSSCHLSWYILVTGYTGTLFSVWYVWWLCFPPGVGWSCPVVVKLMPGASKVCSCVVCLIPSCCSCIEGLNWTLWCYNQPYATVVSLKLCPRKFSLVFVCR